MIDTVSPSWRHIWRRGTQNAFLYYNNYNLFLFSFLVKYVFYCHFLGGERAGYSERGASALFGAKGQRWNSNFQILTEKEPARFSPGRKMRRRLQIFDCFF